MRKPSLIFAAAVLVSVPSLGQAGEKHPSGDEMKIVTAFNTAVAKTGSLEALSELHWAPGASFSNIWLLKDLIYCKSSSTKYEKGKIITDYEWVDNQHDCNLAVEMKIRDGLIRSATIIPTSMVMTAKRLHG